MELRTIKISFTHRVQDPDSQWGSYTHGFEGFFQLDAGDDPVDAAFAAWRFAKAQVWTQEQSVVGDDETRVYAKRPVKLPAWMQDMIKGPASLMPGNEEDDDAH